MTAERTLCCAGAWTLEHLRELDGEINCDVGAIAALDTSGAWLLQRTLSQFERHGCTVAMQRMPDDFAALMQTVARSWSQTAQYQRLAPPRSLERLGQWAWNAGGNLHEERGLHRIRQKALRDGRLKGGELRLKAVEEDV